ncbi:MAG TPA: hypothetical protein VF173_22765 [Thermoanaerobaculia bacterium]|nr:hypothetical protein [Thermoanaerobaculia bacterium]
MSTPAPPGAAVTARRDRWHLAAACLVLIAGIWANTGTLAPYGATLDHPFVWEPCKYLLNIDHFHFKATFFMLDGATREQWAFSVVLRRLLYPLIAYPFMKLLGFGGGGLAVNTLLAVGSVVVFWLALRRRSAVPPSPAVLWLLATYPGIFYWAGLPYSYAAIVPFSLLSLVLLWRVERLATWREALLCGLALGVLFTGYDLLPFFGAAAILLLLYRRLWGPCAVLAVTQVVPLALVLAFLKWHFGVPVRNSNSEAYAHVLGSYFSPIDGQKWGELLLNLPTVLVDSFLYSNFLFLPLLFLTCLAVSRRLPKDGRTLPVAEISLLLAAALLFLFNNAAPPYDGWQLRGTWIARLYQPVFVAILSFLAVFFGRSPLLPRPWRLGTQAALALTLLANAWVVFAPLAGHAGLSGLLYNRFYRHATATSYAANLRVFGARPVGFCDTAPRAPASVTH